MTVYLNFSPPFRTPSRPHKDYAPAPSSHKPLYRSVIDSRFRLWRPHPCQPISPSPPPPLPGVRSYRASRERVCPRTALLPARRRCPSVSGANHIPKRQIIQRRNQIDIIDHTAFIHSDSNALPVLLAYLLFVVMNLRNVKPSNNKVICIN